MVGGAAKSLWRDEEGLSTLAMVVSLLLTLSLIFAGAQIYRVNSASAEVQDVADAAALSAENQVAEFMIVAQFCDATVLSLSLTGLTAAGLGVVALCTPPTAALSDGLLSAAKNVLNARDRFAERAAQVLNKLQEALPFFAAVSAAAVAQANNENTQGAAYLGAALLVEPKGEAIQVGGLDEASELMKEIEARSGDIKAKAAEAEEAAQQANEAKQRGFQRDCGDDPNHCMYERASRLASLDGVDNPRYSSVDTWSFQVPLDRARAYYKKRLILEAPGNPTVEEQARSALRRNFYRYADKQLQQAYVHETADTFEAYFPIFPRNTQQMRETALYSDPIYPITGSGDNSVMHAWAGCPEAAGASSYGSVAQMEEGGFVECPQCCFNAASLGKVAAASATIDNGFEYHYLAVAQAAADYQKASTLAQGPKREVKEAAGGLLARLAELVRSAADKRIHPTPPGRYGALAFVVNLGDETAAGGLVSNLVPGQQALGPRAAVSAATLLKEESAEGKTVINSMLDGLRRDGTAAVGAAGFVLDVWSYMLVAWDLGQEALAGGIRNVLDSLPLVGASGLGTWASQQFQSALENVGLEPADLKARKAVLVNSGHVAAKGSGAIAGYHTLKQRVVTASQGADDLFSMVLNDAESQAISQIQGLGDSVTIASIELLGEGGPSIPVTIPIPEAVRSAGQGLVEDIFDRLRSLRGEPAQEAIWR